MLLGFTNTNISNNRKSLSHNSLSLFLKSRQNSNNSHFLCKVEENPGMINQNHLILLSFGKRMDFW